MSIQKLGIMALEHTLEQFFITIQWKKFLSNGIQWW
jgi:hypothetical protein